jgi:hypothetical protein
MFFTRTQRYQFGMPKEDLRKQLLAERVNIHHMEFEIFEYEGVIRIVPNDEDATGIKTLPVTYVDLKGEGNATKVTVTSKMRKIDSGGPILIVIFCTFMLIAAGILLYVDPKQTQIPYTLLGIGLLFITLFTVRMQTGYFDYVRKIRAYIRSKGVPVNSANVNLPFAPQA